MKNCSPTDTSLGMIFSVLYLCYWREGRREESKTIRNLLTLLVFPVANHGSILRNMSYQILNRTSFCATMSNWHLEIPVLLRWLPLYLSQSGLSLLFSFLFSWWKILVLFTWEKNLRIIRLNNYILLRYKK